MASVTTTAASVDVERLGNSQSLAGGQDLRDGLRSNPRRIPSHYGYDKAGSALFDAITDIPSYFLTWVEADLLRAHAQEICGVLGTTSFAELGSGSARKTRLLLQALPPGSTFYPIDISEEMLVASAERLGSELDISIRGLAAPWDVGLDWLRQSLTEPVTVAFLGSSIGNMAPSERANFLAMFEQQLRPGDTLLVTADLQKTPAEFVRAYIDPPGSKTWAQFRINRLAHINRLFGADFDLTRFYDNSIYNIDTHTIESFLVSASAQSVHIPQLELDLELAKGERIIVDYSVKFDRDELLDEINDHGFTATGQWIDGPRQYGIFTFERR